MNYEAKIIEEFASRLYDQAASIIFRYLLIGAVVGGAAGYAMGKGPGALIGALVLAGVGYSMAADKAFQLKLQAQTALCQVQIEKNTRGDAPMPATVASSSAAAFSAPSSEKVGPSGERLA